MVLAGNTLYGTTTYGGSGGAYGDGVVFKVNADGSGYAVLKDYFTSRSRDLLGPERTP